LLCQLFELFFFAREVRKACQEWWIILYEKLEVSTETFRKLEVSTETFRMQQQLRWLNRKGIYMAGFLSLNFGSTSCEDLLKSKQIVVVGNSIASKSATDELRSILQKSPDARLLEVKWIDEESISQFAPYTKTIQLTNNRKISFDKCILAPKRPLSPIPLHMIDQEILSNLQYLRKFLDPRKSNDLQIATEIIQSGGHVTIIGANNWTNIQVALKLASIAKEAGFVNAVTLVYPTYGIMSTILPRYLSLSLADRLESKGIELIPFSHIKYLSRSLSRRSQRASNNNNNHNNDTSSIAVYVSRSYDSLHTNNFSTDAIILTPSALTSDILEKGSQVMYLQNLSWLLSGEITEVDRWVGGIPVNRSLAWTQDVYVVGECANVSVNTATIGHPHLQSYRHLIQGHYSAAFSGQLAAKFAVDSLSLDQRISDTQSMNIYRQIPLEIFHTDDLNISYIAYGMCNPILESHTYSWKLPSLPKSSSISKKAIHKAPELSEYLKKDFQRVFSSPFQQHSNTSKEVSFEKKGILTVQKVKASNSNSAPSTTLATATNTWVSKQSSTGLSISFYIDMNDLRICGILISGFPTQLLTNLSRDNNVDDIKVDDYTAHHVNMQLTHQLDQILNKYLQLSLSLQELPSQEALRYIDTTRIQFVSQLQKHAEDLLHELSLFYTHYHSGISAADGIVSNEEVQHFLSKSRRNYRHVPSSLTFAMEMQEHLKQNVMGKVSHVPLDGNLFQWKSNTGSRSDRVKAAYQQGIMQAMQTNLYDPSVTLRPAEIQAMQNGMHYSNSKHSQQ
jgi:hypothetical protein